MSQKRFSLRVSIFVAFALVVGCLGTGIGLYTYTENREASLSLAETLLAVTHTIVEERLRSTMRPVSDTVDLLAKIPVVAHAPAPYPPHGSIRHSVDFSETLRPGNRLGEPRGPNPTRAAFALLQDIIANKPQAFSAFILHRDGRFQRVMRLRGLDPTRDREARAALNAPPDTTLIFQTIAPAPSGRLRAQWHYFAENGDLLADRAIEPVLPWASTEKLFTEFETAPESDLALSEDPFETEAFGPRVLGFHVLPQARRIVSTIAVPVASAPPAQETPDGQPVEQEQENTPIGEEIRSLVGIDVALLQLSDFMNRQRPTARSRQVIADAQGRILVHSDLSEVVSSLRGDGGILEMVPRTLDQIGDPMLSAILSQYQTGALQPGRPASLLPPGTVLPFEDHVALATPLPANLVPNGVLMTGVPVDDFVGPVAHLRAEIITITGIAILIALWVAWGIAEAVSNPLKRLTREAGRIRSLNFTEQPGIRSRIAEIHELAEATESMKTGLRTFGLYVPGALVRKIVETGTTPERGGDRRPLSLLFTDIAGFTTLSETIPPEELTVALSEYFTAMGHEIVGRGGVIDKYVGDALMAFWNAPETRPDHCFEAVCAMMAAANAVERFNQTRIKNQLPPFPTRFGLHMGISVVGNVGTPDRLNYTALGDSVNVAARLEGLNKTYGTTLLVSEDVVAEVGNRIGFRRIDTIAPRGRDEAVTLFEPIGLLEAEALSHKGAPLPVHAPEEMQQRLELWETALRALAQEDHATARAAFQAYDTRFGPDPVAQGHLAALPQ